MATRGGYSSSAGVTDTGVSAFDVGSGSGNVNSNSSDVKFTYGLQGGAKLGLTKIFGAKVDLDFGSRELSLISGRKYVNESYAASVDILGFSFGFDASRNRRVRNFDSSASRVLAGRDFKVQPVFSTPWSVSSKEFWKIDFGVSAFLGIEGTFDFGGN